MLRAIKAQSYCLYLLKWHTQDTPFYDVLFNIQNWLWLEIQPKYLA